ncbi:MAG: GFA family protein, partial [Hyphomicrobium sp.]
MNELHTGGCQCGAVRFRVEGELGDASVCHCRMCQKAFGSFYAPLVTISD